MKTYLLNIPKELKNISQKLDANALLCNKTWEVLNDEGDKQVFIFERDGRLIISTNGDVINSTWQFITANNSIIITALNQTTMLRPAFIDGVVFAMRKDGTEECLFLIDEQNKSICPNRTLTELKLYFHQEAEKILEAEAKQLERQQREREQQQREREQQQREEEKLRRIAIEHRDEIEALAKRKKNKLLSYFAFSTPMLIVFIILAIFFKDNESLFTAFLLVSVVIITFDLLVIVLYPSSLKESAESEIIEKYRKQ